MPPKKNPLKLNKLQLRTLALAQVLARDKNAAKPDAHSGDIYLMALPQPHGDHVHVGEFVVSARDASGLANKAVWNALARKGLVRTDGPVFITVTEAGLAYDTGYGERFLSPSDH